jgi:hypothetical protein
MKINVAEAMRELLDREKVDCMLRGSLDAIHRGVYCFFSVQWKYLTPKEAFFLGELYQSSSVDAAEYIVQEFEDELTNN